MFDIGFSEIILIGVVGLVVIGPERLPGVARTLGTWVGRTRRFIDQVKRDVSAELNQEELRKAIEDNVGLDEIKKIMTTDHFTLENETEATPEYQVKAIHDKPAGTHAEVALDDDKPAGTHTKAP